MSRLNMSFRIACRSNAEIPLALNILYQLAGVSVMVWQRELPVRRNIAPKCQNILNALLF